MDRTKINQDEIDKRFNKLKNDAEPGGYHLNPDTEFTKDLIDGLLVNEKRYGYPSCPCRLAEGIQSEDLDIVCPCDYRDVDVSEYDTCYCGLYVSRSVIEGKKSIGKIPERRPPKTERKMPASAHATKAAGLTFPIWRCRVCGYLCARDNPPEVCPICKAKKERFEVYIERQ